MWADKENAVSKTAQEPQDTDTPAKSPRRAKHLSDAWTYVHTILQDGPMRRGAFVQRISFYARAVQVDVWLREGKLIQEGVSPSFVALPKDASKARAMADTSHREVHGPPRYSAKILLDLQRHKETAERAAEQAKAQLRAERERHAETMDDLSARYHDRTQEEKKRHEEMLRQLQAEHEVLLDQERARHKRRADTLTQDEADACRALGLANRALSSLDTAEPAPVQEVAVQPVAEPVAVQFIQEVAPVQFAAEPKVVLVMGDQMLDEALDEALDPKPAPRRGKRAPQEVKAQEPAPAQKPAAKVAQEPALAQKPAPQEVAPVQEVAALPLQEGASEARIWEWLELHPKGKTAHTLGAELGLDVGFVRATLQRWLREGKVKVWNFTYSIPQKPEGVSVPDTMRLEVKGKDLVYRLEKAEAGARAGWKVMAPSSFASWCEEQGHTGAFFFTMAEMKAAFSKYLDARGVR